MLGGKKCSKLLEKRKQTKFQNYAWWKKVLEIVRGKETD